MHEKFIPWYILIYKAVSYNVLADVANGLQCCLFHHLCAVLIGHVACHNGDQVWPQTGGQLRTCYVCNTLGS